MATERIEKQSCDKCGRALKGHRNSMNIVTSLRDSSSWSRLHVQVTHIHGFHNDAQEDPADLCKPCAVALLTDALKRVRSGERATKGTEDSSMQGWK